MNKDDVANAVFGLGLYIDMMVDHGYDPVRLDFLMQSYLNLQADLAGLEHPDLAELRSRVVIAQPGLEDLIRGVAPRWLPVCEKLRIAHLGSPGIVP